MGTFKTLQTSRVPPLLAWKYETSIVDPRNSRLSTKGKYDIPLSLYYHPQDSNHQQKVIINPIAAKIFRVKLHDPITFTFAGKNGGTYSINAKVDRIKHWNWPLPYIWVSADILATHFEFQPDEGLFSQKRIALVVHGQSGVLCTPGGSGGLAVLSP